MHKGQAGKDRTTLHYSAAPQGCRHTPQVRLQSEPHEQPEMQRPVEADCQYGRHLPQSDHARRAPHVCDVGADKGCRHILCEQDARSLQRSHDREIRPGSPDNRN